jgi:hypothetical protein
MARTAQISKEKQQPIISLRHEGQSMRKCPAQDMKTQDPLLQSISSLELPASEIAAQINGSEFK